MRQDFQLTVQGSIEITDGPEQHTPTTIFDVQDELQRTITRMGAAFQRTPEDRVQVRIDTLAVGLKHNPTFKEKQELAQKEFGAASIAFPYPPNRSEAPPTDFLGSASPKVIDYQAEPESATTESRPPKV